MQQAVFIKITKLYVKKSALRNLKLKTSTENSLIKICSFWTDLLDKWISHEPDSVKEKSWHYYINMAKFSSDFIRAV